LDPSRRWKSCSKIGCQNAPKNGACNTLILDLHDPSAARTRRAVCARQAGGRGGAHCQGGEDSELRNGHLSDLSRCPLHGR
jgi:hypothetical protein